MVRKHTSVVHLNYFYSQLNETAIIRLRARMLLLYKQHLTKETAQEVLQDQSPLQLTVSSLNLLALPCQQSQLFRSSRVKQQIGLTARRQTRYGKESRENYLYNL